VVVAVLVTATFLVVALGAFGAVLGLVGAAVFTVSRKMT
jgi:hypothetical protein